jgi:folate-binding Fe-S cluster repair protein YgfZ
MLNLEALSGLSFQKGCYPGQEIIARLQYRGEVKRRMFLCGAKGDGVPTAGQPLFRRLRDGPHKAGEVLAAERHRDGVALLAVIDIAASDTSLHLGDPGGPLLSLMPLPYAVPG